MLSHELTSEQCREVLGRAELGRLACSRFDQPYVVPIHFSFDPGNDCVYAFFAVGQKVKWMRENPKVCLEVEEIDDRNSWTTVVMFGRYEEIHRSSEESAARRRAEELLSARQEWWLPAAANVEGRECHDVVACRIQIERLTAHRTDAFGCGEEIVAPREMVRTSPQLSPQNHSEKRPPRGGVRCASSPATALLQTPGPHHAQRDSSCG